MITLVYCLD